MQMLNKEIREATKKRFDEAMEDKVTLLFFTQEPSRLIFAAGKEAIGL